MQNQFEERRVWGLELRDAEVDKRTMTGLAAPYGVETPIGGQYVEVLAPGVFKKSIREAAKGLPLLAFHNSQTWPVGKSVEWRETDAGLEGTWEFATTDEATKTYEMARDGFITGLSVGFQPIDSHVEPGNDTTPTTVYRREARLFEVSVVPTPAYASAQIMLVRTAGPKIARPHADRWKRWAAENLGA
jgi:HK97 family phage prohead protease